MDLSGRVAAITGAPSGMGVALAQHVAREGVAVTLGARRGDRLDDAVRGIRAAGGRAEAVLMDVTIEPNVHNPVQRAQETLGRLDIMIGNAGSWFYRTAEAPPRPTIHSM